jgi:hypothetical protein
MYICGKWYWCGCSGMCIYIYIYIFDLPFYFLKATNGQVVIQRTKTIGEKLHIIPYLLNTYQNSKTKLMPCVSYEAYFNIEHLHCYSRRTRKEF